MILTLLSLFVVVVVASPERVLTSECLLNPSFNLSRPARASAEFVVINEAGDSISWNVHPSLIPIDMPRQLDWPEMNK
jgi:hypothetical protein